MNPLALPEQVIAIAGDGFDPATIAAGISWASSIIRGYTRQTFDLVEDDVEIITPAGYLATVSQLPVVSVSKVEAKYIDPVTGASSYEQIGGWDWSPSGIVYATVRQSTPSTGWPEYTLPGGLRITYSHGFDSVPEDIADICARLTFQYVSNPIHRVERKVGGKTDRWTTDGGSSFTPYDLAVLDQYRVVNLV